MPRFSTSVPETKTPVVNVFLLGPLVLRTYGPIVGLPKTGVYVTPFLGVVQQRACIQEVTEN